MTKSIFQGQLADNPGVPTLSEVNEHRCGLLASCAWASDLTSLTLIVLTCNLEDNTINSNIKYFLSANMHWALF